MNNWTLVLVLTLAGIAAAGREEQIFGGVDEPKFTSVVYIQNNGNFLCTGTLISNKVVICADYCMDGKVASNLTLKLGQSEIGTGGCTRTAEEIKMDSKGILNNYATTDATANLPCGVSAIILGSTVPTSCAKPAYLDCRDKTFAGENYLAVGWGSTSGDATFPTKLQAASVTITSSLTACQAAASATATSSVYTGFKFFAPPVGSCVSGPDPNYRGLCAGDAGAPLIQDQADATTPDTVLGIGYYAPAGCQQANKWSFFVTADHFCERLFDMVGCEMAKDTSVTSTRTVNENAPASAQGSRGDTERPFNVCADNQKGICADCKKNGNGKCSGSGNNRETGKSRKCRNKIVQDVGRVCNIEVGSECSETRMESNEDPEEETGVHGSCRCCDYKLKLTCYNGKNKQYGAPLTRSRRDALSFLVPGRRR